MITIKISDAQAHMLLALFDDELQYADQMTQKRMYAIETLQRRVLKLVAQRRKEKERAAIKAQTSFESKRR